MSRGFLVFPLMLLLLNAAGARAPFVPDEFDQGRLGPAWRRAPAARGDVAVQGGALVLRPAGGTERSYSRHDTLWIEQPAPAGADWELITRIDAFDPVLNHDGLAPPWSECGLQLHQDERHWFGIWLNTNQTGHRLDVTCGFQMEPGEIQGKPFDPFFCGDMAVWDIRRLPVWLRLRKTAHGYFGAYRVEGEPWRNLGPFARNPDSPADGFLRGETVRLYAAAPAADVPPPVCRIGFIRFRELEPLPRAGGSDGFDDERLDRARWGVYEGAPSAATLAESGGALHLTPRMYQEINTNFDTAPCVYQPAPAAGPWRASVKAGPTDLRAHQAWSAYGLMLWQDQNHWILVRNQVDDGRRLRSQALRHEGRRLWVETRDYLAGELPPYLCIERWGDAYRCGTSQDGRNWEYLNDAGEFVTERPFDNAQLQLFATRPTEDDAGATLTARFDAFHIEPLGEPAAGAEGLSSPHAD